MGGGYIPLGAPRQDRTPMIQTRFLFLALVTFGVVGGLAFIEFRREAAAARSLEISANHELDARFMHESRDIERRLSDLKDASVRSLAFLDRRRFPNGVVSVSVWEKSSAGILKKSGLPASGVWEQALYRILPAELAKHRRFVVLPLSGPELATDPSSEMIRLAVFTDVFPESQEGMRFTVVAFKPDVLFASAPVSDGVKRVLIEKSGLILAHSRPSEVGQRTSALAELYTRKERENKRDTVHSLASKSWEGFPSTIRFAQISGWAAYFVLEKTHAPVQASGRAVIFFIAIFGVLIGILFLGLAFFPSRSLSKKAPQIPKNEGANLTTRTPAPRLGLRELRANPPLFSPRPSAISLTESFPDPNLVSELGRFIAAREARSESHELNRSRREVILLEEFEGEARRARSVAQLEAKLVTSISGTTRSPVLFFRYEPIQGIARIVAEAGYPASQSILRAGGMSFALENRLLAEIHADRSRGQMKNLWEYAPLARIMLTRLGIANFEAWAMVEARRPTAGPSRLLGILVIAESGVDSVLHREFLGSLLERASLHYARQNA